MHSEKYGYLTSSIEDLGTSMKACVTISLPKLGRELKMLSEICDSHNVVVGRDSSDPIYRYQFIVQNKSKLGHSEKQLIEALWYGVKALIRKDLELDGQDITELREEKPA